jgi:hypothetical protein
LEHVNLTHRMAASRKRKKSVMELENKMIDT